MLWTLPILVLAYKVIDFIKAVEVAIEVYDPKFKGVEGAR